MRVATHPRALWDPLLPAEAWGFVEDWLDAPLVWTPEPGRTHRELVGRLVQDLDLRGNLVPDAVLAVLCLEHGLTMVSADSGSARFPGLTWFNPVAPG